MHAAASEDFSDASLGMLEGEGRGGGGGERRRGISGQNTPQGSVEREAAPAISTGRREEGGGRHREREEGEDKVGAHCADTHSGKSFIHIKFKKVLKVFIRLEVLVSEVPVHLDGAQSFTSRQLDRGVVGMHGMGPSPFHIHGRCSPWLTLSGSKLMDTRSSVRFTIEITLTGSSLVNSTSVEEREAEFVA